MSTTAAEKKDILEYTIASGSTITELIQSMAGFMRNGWTPMGSISQLTLRADGQAAAINEDRGSDCRGIFAIGMTRYTSPSAPIDAATKTATG